MSKDELPVAVTVDGYWGQLRAWGFGNRQRVTPSTYTMVGMDDQVINVACPENLSPEQRAAVLALIRSVHLGTPH